MTKNLSSSRKYRVGLNRPYPDKQDLATQQINTNALRRGLECLEVCNPANPPNFLKNFGLRRLAMRAHAQEYLEQTKVLLGASVENRSAQGLQFNRLDNSESCPHFLERSELGRVAEHFYGQAIGEQVAKILEDHLEVFCPGYSP